MVSFEHAVLQFARLVRHEHIASIKKDTVAYLDLSHCLRVWVDMKLDIQRIISGTVIRATFENPDKSRQLKQFLRGTNYWTLPLASRYGTDFGVVSNFVVTNEVLTDEEIKAFIDIPSPTPHPTEFTFSEWLGAEVFGRRIKKGDRGTEYIGISREMFVKRIANILGGSHPAGVELEEPDRSANRFDEHILGLHRVHVGTDLIPATFMQLLEIARDLIAALSPVFGLPKIRFRLLVEYKIPGRVPVKMRCGRTLEELQQLLDQHSTRRLATTVRLERNMHPVGGVQQGTWHTSLDTASLIKEAHKQRGNGH